MKNIKKILLSTFVVIVFGVYAFHDQLGSLAGRDEKAHIVVPEGLNTTKNTSPSPTANKAAGSSPVAQAKYKDGTYVGNVTDAFYGNLQVEAIISDGKIADVKFLQYPNDRATSIEINTQAMPLLTAEAIQAQRAQVDGVS